MPKDKKKQKVVDFGPKLHPIRDMPCESCKNFLIELTVKFYEENTLRALESKYVGYRDGGPEKFRRDMWQHMMDALQAPIWSTETEKRGFLKFVHDRVHNAL
jgi:hypothetical protein